MSTAIVPSFEVAPEERALLTGDLAKLSPDQRASLVASVCRSVGLNPLTQPLQYITLNGKLTLYARKDCTDQLRAIHNVSVAIDSKEQVGDLYIVTVRAFLPSGRSDSEIGAVATNGLRGEALANAMMKAITKAKRRATLSICGLGFLDELEVETIPSAQVWQERTNVTTGEITTTAPAQLKETNTARAATAAAGTAADLATEPQIKAIKTLLGKLNRPIDWELLGSLTKAAASAQIQALQDALPGRGTTDQTMQIDGYRDADVAF